MTLIKLKDRPPRKTWRGKLVKALAVAAILLVALYFAVTSEMFLKRIILPQVSNAIKADVTAASAKISPFRQIVLRDLKINPRGNEPLLAVKEIRLRYSLLSIIRGKIVVEEVTIDSPTFTVVEKADGTSNLDELLKLGGSEKKEPSPKSSDAPVVNVKLVALNNATVRFEKRHASGPADVVEVSGLNFSIHDLKNGQAGKLEVTANLALDQAAQVSVAAGSLRAKLNGGFTFDLTQDLKPASVKGNATFTVEQATGSLADAGTLAVLLDCEATPTEVKQLALRFIKADAALGEVRVTGPLDLARLEGKLKLEVLSLDRRLLNLAGAASGIDFGPTTINSTTDLELTSAGSKISLAGRLNVANFQVSRAGQTSPTLDLRCDYAVVADRAAETLSLNFFNLSGTQDSQLFLQSELPSPLTMNWGNKGGATASDALFNLVVTNWNLAGWQAFAGEATPTGLVNTKLKLASQQGGKQLQLELDGGVNGFSLKSGSNQVSQADVRWQVRAQATDLKQFKLEDYLLEITQQGQSALVMSASGTFDSVTGNADLQVAGQAMLARLLAFAPQPGVNVSAGTLAFNNHIVGKGDSQTITGQLTLTNLTGGQGNLHLTSYGAAVDFDVAMKGDSVELRKVSGLVREGQKVGGQFNVSGKLNLGGQPTGQVAVKLTDFNQEGLRPFIESALGGKKLVTVSLNTTATVNFGAQGDAAIKADLSVTNLVVLDPLNPQPATPLQTRIQVDVTMAGAIAEIRQCQLTLTPTARAKNELNLTGKVDSSKPDAITGNLKLAAAALDVTRYYDLVAGNPAVVETNKVAKPAAGAQPAPASTTPEQEPEAVKLPFQNFTFEVAINRFYLREVDIADLLATAKIDGGHVVVKPCQMKLNGAPITASVDADLGVPGFKYDVAFRADTIAFAPLVNSFAPDRKDQIGGTLTADAQIKGAGVTGISLQKNLTGQFDVTATNLNLAIGNVRSPILKTLVNVIIGIPELIRNPAEVLGNVVGRLTGNTTQKSGWTEELNASPINVILVRGQASTGRLQLQHAEVRGGAFQAQAAGEILLAPVLTNSTIEIPVKVALGRKLASQAGLLPSNAPTNMAYVELPDFLTLKGTLGEPKSHYDKIGILALVAKTGGGVATQIGGASGEKAGALLNTVGGLFSKPDNTATNASGTNAPAKSGGLFDLFKKPKK